MSLDRLKEIKNIQNIKQENEEKIQEIKEKPDPIDFEFTTIKTHIDIIKNLQEEYKKAITEEAKQLSFNLLTGIQKLVLQSILCIKIDIDKLNGELKYYYIQKLQKIMIEYNNTVNDFKTLIKSTQYRQLRLLNPELTENDMDTLVLDRNFYKKLLISDNLTSIINDIEKRNSEILKIERDILELFSIFKDLGILVDEQQERLNSIEYKVMKSRDYTEKGEYEIQEAHKLQQTVRNRKLCCCFVLSIIIFIVIIIPVLEKTL